MSVLMPNAPQDDNLPAQSLSSEDGGNAAVATRRHPVGRNLCLMRWSSGSLPFIGCCFPGTDGKDTQRANLAPSDPWQRAVPVVRGAVRSARRRWPCQ